jgi:hypothetical protein
LETAQVKDDSGSKQALVAPLQANHSSTPDLVNDETNPLSDIASPANTEDSPILPPDSAERSQENQPIDTPTPHLDDESAPKVEESSTKVPQVQDQDVRQADPTDIHDHEEIPATNDSSQEWVSLAIPDNSLPPISASDVQPEEPSTLSVPPEQETPQAEAPSTQEEASTTLEFSSATLIDVPDKLHETLMTIRSDTSSPTPSTPEPDVHSFDAAVRIQTDAEKQVPLNPQSSAEFGAVGVGEHLKARTASTSSLHSASGSIHRAGAVSSELSAKKKRGGSFMRKSSTLVNKVFKSKDASSDNGSSTTSSPRLASSFVSEPEHSEPSASEARKKLTSPSRVSLGSIRSTGGSIKRKMGRSSTASDRDAVLDQEEPQVASSEHLPSNSSTGKGADAAGAGPSLLKTMFKVRKPSK